MDLGTMHYKLNQGLYANREAFRDDFKLVVGNAHIYNGTGYVVDQANEMDTLFDKLWTRVIKTLDAMMDKTWMPPGVTSSYDSLPPITPSYESAPAPIKLRLSIAPQPSTPAAATPYVPTPYVPTPTTATPSGISFKLKLAPPTSTYTPSAPEPSKPSTGFKVKFNTSGLGSASATPPPYPSYEAPTKIKLTSSKASTSFEDDLFESIKPSIKLKSKKNRDPDYVGEGTNRSDSRESSVASSAMGNTTTSMPPIGKALNDPVSMKKARGVMKKMMELPESWFFQLPVEAVGALAT